MRRDILSLRWVTMLVAAGLLAVAGRATSAEPRKAKKAADAEQMVVKTYDVRGVMQAGDAEPLKDLCTQVIAPQTWEQNGGEATLAVLGTKLTVRNNAAAQENIAALLDALRKLSANRKAARAVPRNRQILVGTQKDGDSEMQIAIYPVGDLVLGRQNDSENIRDHLTKTVAPQSWEENGGAGTIHPYPMAVPVLVVSNTSEVQKKIVSVLNQLRPSGKGNRNRK